MKNTVKGLLLTGGMLLAAGCTPTNPVPRLMSGNTQQPMVMKPFALNPMPDFAWGAPVCRRDDSLFPSCGLENRSTTRSMLVGGIRENMFDNLSDRLTTAFSGDSHKRNKNSRWRLKRDRVEWQYKF